MQNITFARNFGGRASATEFSSIHFLIGDNVHHVVVDPSEFRIREDGTVTVYSRKHRSTSVYGKQTKNFTVVGITRKGNHVRTLVF